MDYIIIESIRVITNAGNPLKKCSKNQIFLANCCGLIMTGCQIPRQPPSLPLLMGTKWGGKAHGSCWCDQRQKPAPPHGPPGLQGSPCLRARGSIPPHPLWELAGLRPLCSPLSGQCFAPSQARFPRGAVSALRCPAAPRDRPPLTALPSRPVCAEYRHPITNHEKKPHCTEKNTAPLFIYGS